jgi:hypothetical protein
MDVAWGLGSKSLDVSCMLQVHLTLDMAAPNPFFADVASKAMADIELQRNVGNYTSKPPPPLPGGMWTNAFVLGKHADMGLGLQFRDHCSCANICEDSFEVTAPIFEDALHAALLDSVRGAGKISTESWYKTVDEEGPAKGDGKKLQETVLLSIAKHFVQNDTMKPLLAGANLSHLKVDTLENVGGRCTLTIPPRLVQGDATVLGSQAHIIPEKKIVFFFSVATDHPSNNPLLACPHMNTAASIILAQAENVRVVNILGAVGWGGRTGGKLGPKRLKWLRFDAVKRDQFTYEEERLQSQKTQEEKEKKKRSDARERLVLQHDQDDNNKENKRSSRLTLLID